MKRAVLIAARTLALAGTVSRRCRLARVSVSLSRVPGQTPFGIFQNVLPREWSDCGYITLHAGSYRLYITISYGVTR